jgi:prepilin-type N-terminal cleavage/methylation domain-containing protein
VPRQKEEVVKMSYLIYPGKRLHYFYPGGDNKCELRDAGRGFTAVELLVVVVIMAIAALTVVPMMSSASSMQLRSAANMIMADLEYAKSMAISRGQNYSVVFDENAESYSIEDQSSSVIPHPVKKGFDYIIDFQNDSRLNKVNIADADFDSTSSVQFDCLGSPDNGGTISLQAGSMTMIVRVEPITGYIRVE